MQPTVVVSSGSDTQCNNSRYLPTYNVANTQYTLRLPTYRSSYIRRFHPYARIPRFVEEVRQLNFVFLYARLLTRRKDDSDNDLYDEGTLLDLRILGTPVEPQLPITAEDRTEGTLDKVPAEELPTTGVPLFVGPSTGNASDLGRATL